MIGLNQFDAKTFVKKIEKPWGYEIVFTPETLDYAGKIIHITSGKQIPMIVHDKVWKL